MEANPYSTPSANLYGASTGGGDVVAPSTIAQLAGTKGWVRLFSVVMWLGVLLYLLMALVMALTGNAAFAEISRNTGAAAGQVLTYVIPAVYAIFGLMLGYPAAKMWKYANAIGRLVASHALADLDDALTHQRRYWKFTGILIILGVCFFAIFLVGMTAFGMSMARAGGV